MEGEQVLKELEERFMAFLVVMEHHRLFKTTKVELVGEHGELAMKLLLLLGWQGGECWSIWRM